MRALARSAGDAVGGTIRHARLAPDGRFQMRQRESPNQCPHTCSKLVSCIHCKVNVQGLARAMSVWRRSPRRCKATGLMQVVVLAGHALLPAAAAAAVLLLRACRSCVRLHAPDADF